MENQFLSAIMDEIAPALRGRVVAKVGLADNTIMMDARLADGRVLVVDLGKNDPALYLSKRRLDSSDASNQFLLLLRKHLSGARIVDVSKAPSDRIVRISLERHEPGGGLVGASVVLALTGRSTNAFLLREDDVTIGSLR